MMIHGSVTNVVKDLYIVVVAVVLEWAVAALIVVD